MAAHKSYPEVKPAQCRVCGVWFSGLKVMRRPHGLVLQRYNGRRVCSEACRREMFRTDEARKAKISAAFSGDRHWNWQGGKSRLNNIGARGPGWQKARGAALKRDGFRCVDCGMTAEQCREKFGRGLDVDHVEPFHNFRSSVEANRLSNLASRCASCHTVAEARRTNVQQVLPFADSLKRRHTGRVRGERVNTAKLTAADVQTIRRRFAAGEGRTALAGEFGIRKEYVNALVQRKSWKHIA